MKSLNNSTDVSLSATSHRATSPFFVMMHSKTGRERERENKNKSQKQQRFWEKSQMKIRYESKEKKETDI